MKLRDKKGRQNNGYDSFRNKLMFHFFLLFCGISLLAGLLDSQLQYRLSEAKLILVSEDARSSIYREKENNVLAFKSNIMKEIKKDCNITDKTAANVRSLEIDMLKNDDLSFLSVFPNLTSLTIRNAQTLGEKDLTTLRNSGLKSVVLLIDKDDVRKNRKEMPDLNSLMGKKATVKPMKPLLNETAEYEYYLLVSGYYPNIKDDSLDYEKYAAIDRQLTEIVSGVNISKNEPDREKVMKIVFAIVEFLSYDEKISDEFVRIEKNGGSRSKEVDAEITYYNKYVLSSALLDEKHYSKGVCINFAALLEAVCARFGIEAYMIGGTTTQNSEVGHEWNYVKTDGAYRLIDVTAIDVSCEDPGHPFYTSLREYMRKQEKGIDDKEIMQAFTKAVFEDYAAYMSENYCSEDNDEEILAPFDDTKTVAYYNAPYENNTVHRVDYFFSSAIGYYCGMIAVFLATYLLYKTNKSMEINLLLEKQADL